MFMFRAQGPMFLVQNLWQRLCPKRSISARVSGDSGVAASFPNP